MTPVETTTLCDFGAGGRRSDALINTKAAAQEAVAGINCMHSIETIQQYLAHENQHANRTPVQSHLRERTREIRRDESDTEERAVA
ncbi:hypothetical protein Harman_42000 [Haloarcula mannanilytica]|uniref:DUF8129 domain-containing protein n=1 Tax=Haloarcula mannanilytica TaxID=2509225 RepID=A0A4C2EPL9_9EURY|nr:hypothetical protein [Haloarcula mannanilytica]GCF16265.1 hypothetical protein Harman_42000 [Haloarcula mannanilytica]